MHARDTIKLDRSQIVSQKGYLIPVLLAADLVRLPCYDSEYART
jgi:hypothetical protein